MIVTHDYDLIPQDQLPGLRLSGWTEATIGSTTLRTNVRRKVNGRNVPYWPEFDGVWTPAWVTVAE
jgi:hypothetical protein